LKMAKTKQNKRLYSRMRASGVRKKIARQLSELPGHASRGRKAPKPLREAVDRLEAAVVELKDQGREPKPCRSQGGTKARQVLAVGRLQPAPVDVRSAAPIPSPAIWTIARWRCERRRPTPPMG
jgi:hypothetical protein